MSPRRPRLLLLAALVGAAALAGCSQGTPAAFPSSAPPASSPAGTSPAGTAAGTASTPAAPGPAASPGRSPAGPPRKLLVFVEENHSSSTALRQMPFLASQAARYARAGDYRGVAHPSLPNYLAVAGGSTFGVTDDDPPSAHRIAGRSVFGQILAGGGTAKTYAESMAGTCATTDNGRYAVKHNPWPYFVDPAERRACASYDVPAGSPSSGALHRDVAAGTLPTFGLVIPDLCHDGHDCSLATADAWLKPWLSQVEDGPDFRAGRLTVVVTFDEDDRSAGNRVLTVVIDPRWRGVVSPAPLDHYSLSAAVSGLVGASPLRHAAGARDLLDAFPVG